MKNSIIVTLGVAFAFVAIIATSYISANNKGTDYEEVIVASYEDVQNVYSNMGAKLQEAAQVPAMQRDDLTQVITAALNARYGEDGSNAAFQWIQEQNPNIDSAVYTQIQRIIEAGRNDFQLSQTRLIDQKRAYSAQLRYFWSGMWLSAAGFPTIDLDEYSIVTTARSQETFRTGVDTPLQLQP